MNSTIIEIERYEPHPDKVGYVRYIGNITVKELYDQINNRLKTISTTYHNEPCSLYGLLEYFSIGVTIKQSEEEGKRPIPNHRDIAIYVVTGSNEGHYIHIDAIATDTRTSLIMGKTFCGLEMAILIANEITKMLYA